MAIYSIEYYVDILMKAELLMEYNILDTTIEINSITYNSKEANNGTLFACKGAAFKPQYLNEAIENNATCYLSEVLYSDKISYIIVKDVRIAMALVAKMFYENAYEKLNLIGITGTKGKTTTAYYIKYILDEYLQDNFKKPSAILSSIDIFDGKIKEQSHLTTPEAFVLHQHFHNSVECDIDYFTMEVSSQALKYDRVLGVEFDVGVFLNISEDHISPIEHCDFDDYLGSKLKMFEQSKLSIVNTDIDNKDEVFSALKGRNYITFGRENNVDYQSYDMKKQGNETLFKVKSKSFDEQFCLTMPGLFNVENAVAAIAVCDYYKIPIEYMKKGLQKARSKGRMEIYTANNNSLIAVVDYAHNKLSFTKLYQSIIKEYAGREIITVFGCPGNKALNRRTELGELAGQFSDKVYLTADDPAFEKFDDINLEIIKSLKKYDCEYFTIEDREIAVETAILDANDNSVLLILGKGSENVQKQNGKFVTIKTDAEYVEQTFAKMKISLK